MGKSNVSNSLHLIPTNRCVPARDQRSQTGNGARKILSKQRAHFANPPRPKVAPSAPGLQYMSTHIETHTHALSPSHLAHQCVAVRDLLSRCWSVCACRGCATMVHHSVTFVVTSSRTALDAHARSGSGVQPKAPDCGRYYVHPKLSSSCPTPSSYTLPPHYLAPRCPTVSLGTRR